MRTHDCAGHRKRWGAALASWAAEAYDAVGLTVQTLTAPVGQGTVGRAPS